MMEVNVMPDIRQYTRMMMSNEISVLRRLHGMLEHDPVNTRDEFCDLMKAAFNHGKLEPRELSDDLGYSMSTIYRWIEGRSAPHASLWPIVVTWVMTAIDTKIAEHEEERYVVVN